MAVAEAEALGVFGVVGVAGVLELEMRDADDAVRVIAVGAFRPESNKSLVNGGGCGCGSCDRCRG